MGKSAQSSALILVGLLGTTVAHAQRVSLRPSIEEEVIDTKIGGRSVFAMGFYADTNMPITKPFKIDSSASSGNFSYQMPIGIGFDFAYGLSAKWEIGASVGYQRFEAREIGNVASGDNFVTGGFSSIPVSLLVRHRWPEKVIAPEIELALGTAFQRNTIETTVLNSKVFKETRMSPFGHLGAGISYAWGNDLTIHFIGGYTAMMNGKKTYSDDKGQFVVSSNSLVHGFFTRGMVRVQF